MGKVAPHMGAWIEIKYRHPSCYFAFVAPHMGAWIEMRFDKLEKQVANVAPHMGAWIEIPLIIIDVKYRLSRTPHGCVD